MADTDDLRPNSISYLQGIVNINIVNGILAEIYLVLFRYLRENMDTEKLSFYCGKTAGGRLNHKKRKWNERSTNMKQKLAFLVTFVLCLTAILGIVPAQAEEKTYDTPELVLRFPEINAEAGDVGKMLFKFSDLVYERSNGRIKVEIFCGGQLGNEGEMIEQLRLGVVDFMRINPANLASRGIDVPEYTAMGLPYLIQSVEGGLAYLYSDSGKAIADKIAVASDGDILSMYSYIVTTPRHMYTKTLVTNLDEMKEQKIRSETSEMKVDMINCWASATPVAYSEVYTAMQTGVIDGAENPFHGYRDNAWYEVAPYALLTGHAIGASVFMVSAVTWDKFTDDEKVMVTEALKEACDYFQGLQDEGIAAVEADLLAKNVTFTECTDRQAWMDACEPLYAKYAAGLEDFIADIQSYK